MVLRPVGVSMLLLSIAVLVSGCRAVVKQTRTDQRQPHAVTQALFERPKRKTKTQVDRAFLETPAKQSHSASGTDTKSGSGKLQHAIAGEELAASETIEKYRRAVFQSLAPPPEPTEVDLPDATRADGTGVRRIDLSTSLTLVAGRNPTVAFVQERVHEACADLQAAKALWLPSLRAGANYNKHEGSFQDVSGDVFGVSRGSLYTGFGSRAVGASSPAVPGLVAQFHLADAIFQPIIAERTVAARQHTVAAITNDQLLRTALAHLDLQSAVGRQGIAQTTHAELDKLAKLTTSFAKRGQGTQADADRAHTELSLQNNAVIRANASIKTAAARLTEVLSLDDAMQLFPAEAAIVGVELVSPTAASESLVAQALEQRPEISENAFQQSAAFERYRRERYAPLLPHLGAGVSWGGFGGGVGDTITHYKDRLDLDVWAYWEVRNLGFGERAARDAAHSRVHQTQHRYTQLADRIRREVTESLAELHSAIEQLKQAKAATSSAQASLKRNFQRIRGGQGLPLEVLQSIRALDAARNETLNAVVAYSRSQFRLHHALGWPENPAGP